MVIKALSLNSLYVKLGVILGEVKRVCVSDKLLRDNLVELVFLARKTEFGIIHGPDRLKIFLLFHSILLMV